MGSNDFTGRLVLVTGAGSGIGLETALAFARAGARLVITDVNEAALAAARAAVTALGAECLARRCDVSDEQDMGALAEQVNERAGVPDILVNNAGIGYFGLFLDTPTVAWRRAFEVNVMGVVNGIRAFLPAMRAAGGERWVVNVASAAGFAPAPSMSAYAASKHAVIGLSEVFAMELEGSGVRMSSALMRISRRLARRVTLAKAREIGYL